MTFKQEHSINALEIRLQLQYDDFNAYESKAQGYINMSAILVAVLSLLGFTDDKISTVEKLVISLFLVAVGYVFLFSLLTLRGANWSAGIGTSHEALEKFRDFVKTSIDQAYFESMFDSYAKALESNRKVLDAKSNYLKKAKYGVYAESVLILILAVSSLWF